MNTVPVLTQVAGMRAAAAQIIIAGDGTDDLALAAMLSMSGHQVALSGARQRLPERCQIIDRGGKEPAISGFTKLSSNNFSSGASHVLVTVPATEYGATIKRLNPYLNGQETIILCRAALGAAFQFSRQLQLVNRRIQPTIVETAALFDFAEISATEIIISGLRRKINCCGRSRNETHRGLAALSRLWSGLVPACNILERGFMDAEQILKPVLRLFHLLGGDTGLSPDALQVVSAVAAEVSSLARAYRLVLPDMPQLLADYSDFSEASPRQQLEALQALVLRGSCRNAGQCRELLAVEARETLVLLEALARVAHVPVPALDAVIQLSSVITAYDLPARGRSLDDLGLIGLELAEIIEVINS